LRTPAVTDLLKIGRNVPGVLIIAGLVLLILVRRRSWVELDSWSEREVLLCSGLLAGVLLIAGCVSVVTPNWLTAAIYFQPLLVGLFLASLATFEPVRLRVVGTALCVVLPACLAAIRAIGMSTWGVACAADVSYGAAMQRVRAELHAAPPESKILLSSAYLYEAARYTNGYWIHEDYPTPPKSGETFADSLRRLRANKLVLTQFDYYRRYAEVLQELREGGPPVEIAITNTAHLRSPDSYPRLRQVVQHISWAPVIVSLSWR